MELYKKSNIERRVYDNFFFWRGDNMEVDILVEGKNGKLDAYECKYGSEVPSFKKFLEQFSEATVQVVNPENYLDNLV